MAVLLEEEAGSCLGTSPGAITSAGSLEVVALGSGEDPIKVVSNTSGVGESVGPRARSETGTVFYDHTVRKDKDNMAIL